MFSPPRPMHHLHQSNRQCVNNRCSKDHTVKPIQNTAMTGDQGSIIFDIFLSLDRRSSQISHHRYQCSHTTDDRVNQRCMSRIRVISARRCRINRSQKCSTENTSDSSLDGFLGLKTGAILCFRSVHPHSMRRYHIPRNIKRSAIPEKLHPAARGSDRYKTASHPHKPYRKMQS